MKAPQYSSNLDMLSTKDVIGANIRIRNSGLPNYLGEKILVQSKCDIQKLDKLLSDYHDRRLLQFLMFGFPVDHKANEVTISKKNHKGAGVEFDSDVRKYLDKELKREGRVSSICRYLLPSASGYKPNK